VLFGPSGAGKSIVLRSIAGILRPKSARIVVAGGLLEDTDARVRLTPEKRRIGYLPQGYALFPHMTVRQNVSYGLSGIPSGQRAELLEEMLDLVGLKGLESRFPRQLSGGQQQRVALARALAVRPRALLLDEPFAAVDAPLRHSLRSDIARLQEATGVHVITVTHDLADAFALGDWIVVLEAGKVLQQGSRDEVYSRPTSSNVARLLGFRNILRGTVQRSSGGWVSVDWAGPSLLASGPFAGLTKGQRVEVCIRSTHIMIRRPEDVNFDDRPNRMSGVIADEAISAGNRRLFVRLHDSRSRYDLEVDLPEYTYFRLGLDTNKSVDMTVRPDRVHLVPEVADAVGL